MSRERSEMDNALKLRQTKGENYYYSFLTPVEECVSAARLYQRLSDCDPASSRSKVANCCAAQSV